MELTDLEILDHKIGNETTQQMSAISFLQFIAKKLNETPAHSAAVTELRLYVSSPPMARTIPDNEKVRLIRKLLSLGVTL